MKQIVDVTDPDVMKEIAEVVAGILVPLNQKQIGDVFKSIPQLPVSERVVKHIVDVPFPHVMEERVGAARLIHQEQSVGTHRVTSHLGAEC